MCIESDPPAPLMIHEGPALVDQTSRGFNWAVTCASTDHIERASRVHASSYPKTDEDDVFQGSAKTLYCMYVITHELHSPNTMYVRR